VVKPNEMSETPTMSPREAMHSPKNPNEVQTVDGDQTMTKDSKTGVKSLIQNSSKSPNLE